tara:strand:- start:65 stop:316 length:252 start_codon:yes stop_codon:yes gene_type:complete
LAPKVVNTIGTDGVFSVFVSSDDVMRSAGGGVFLWRDLAPRFFSAFVNSDMSNPTMELAAVRISGDVDVVVVVVVVVVAAARG